MVFSLRMATLTNNYSFHWLRDQLMTAWQSLVVTEKCIFSCHFEWLLAAAVKIITAAPIMKA